MPNRAATKREPFVLSAGRAHAIPGDALRSHEPAQPERVVWSVSPDPAHVDAAVAAARAAFPAWRDTPLEQRIEALRAFQRLAGERVDEVGSLICDETGKALWDALTEAQSLSR